MIIMITNQAVNENLNIDQLKDKKASLTERLKELQTDIGKIGITKNQAKYKPHTVNKYLLVQKDKLVLEYNELQREVIDINKNIRKLSERPDYFREIVRQNFPKDIYDRIVSECYNREAGKQANGINFNISALENAQEQIALYKRTLKEYHDMLTQARNEITRFIDINCPDKNKEAFLTKISPINKSVPSLDYFIKKRRVVNY